VDVWIKRTRSLVINHMYGTGVYFDTNGVSQDDFKVGKTRGDGGLGVWDGQKLYVSANWRNYKVITTGPVRSEFELTYDAWDAGNGRMVTETKRISIDAGSNLSRVESIFSSDDKSPLQIGVGLGERPGENVITEDESVRPLEQRAVERRWTIDHWQSSTDKGLVVQNQDEGWMAYWQPQDFYKGTMAVAILLPKGGVQTFTNDTPDLTADKLAAPAHTLQEGQPLRPNRQPVHLLSGRGLGQERRFSRRKIVDALRQTFRRTPRPAAAGDGWELILDLGYAICAAAGE
jgi:hypothetical protein